MITVDTRRCLMLIYAPSRYERQTLEAHARVAADRIARFAGGEITQSRVL
jgi:hypothetical protein